jgi:tetratricopeptide (TPR) repeat protein
MNHLPSGASLGQGPLRTHAQPRGGTDFLSTISPTTRRWIILAFVLVVVFIPGCSRFTKQYKCQIESKVAPRTPYEYVERGMEHIRANEFDCALGACSEAIRLDSTLATAYACRGGVLANTGEFSKALKDFTQALKIQPENGDFYYSRAQIYERLEETDLALVDLAKGVELITSELGRSMAFSQRGGIYQKQGKLDEAIKDYTEAIKLAPQFAYHFDNRGNVYSEKHNYEKAIADYSEAIKLAPANGYFRRDRGKAYRALNQNEAATQDETEAEDLLSKP